MNMLKKYWWLIAAGLIYWKWDVVKTMIGGMTAQPTDVPKPELTETTTETTTEN
jgi:hypothetical protein